MLTKEQIHFLNSAVDSKLGYNWRVNKDSGLVDVEGSVANIPTLRDGKLPVNFGIVTKDFNCSGRNLKSLIGCPQEVGYSFWANHNLLESLEGAPKKVGAGFHCEKNPLISFKGVPYRVGSIFVCDSFVCRLGKWSLEWAIENIEKYPVLKTAIPVEPLQRMINRNPTKMAILLKNYWKELKKDPDYSSLEFPENYKGNAKLVSDLADLGM